MSQQAHHLYEFGPFRLDAKKRLLRRNDEVVRLTAKSLDILLALVESRGEVVSKDELMRQVWPGSFVEEGNLTYNISVLRKALGERAGEHQYIVTIPGKGYKFAADVEETADNGSDVLWARDAKPTPVIQDEGGKPEIEEKPGGLPPALAPPASRRKRTLISLVLAAVAIGAAASYLLYRKGQPVSNDIHSMAILPFVNASADPKAEYLSDGITESLINRLSQLSQLKVIARTTAFRYKGKETDAQQVGRDLHVDAIITGRVIQQGDTLVVQADLLRTADGCQRSS